MGVQVSIALLVALSLGADIPGLTQFRSAPSSLENTFPAALAIARAGAPDSAGVQSSDQPSKTLQPQSRLLLVRFVDGEFARVVQPLPGGKKGYKIPAGKPLDMQHLSDALRLYGTAASQGDTVQITSIEFRADQIVLRINGGEKNTSICAIICRSAWAPCPRRRPSRRNNRTLSRSCPVRLWSWITGVTSRT